MPFIDATVILLYSYLPAIFLALFFWWMDRFEREPIILIVIAFLWGAIGAGMISGFVNTFFQVAFLVAKSGRIASDTLTAVLVAPFIEELTKGAFILVAFWLKRVDNITDGILLGVVIGLGFAASENVLYAENVYAASGELAMWNNLWFREIHTTLLHASATAVWGAFIGYSCFLRQTQRKLTIFNGFILAMLTHGFWNFMAGSVSRFSQNEVLMSLIMRLELFIIFGLLLGLFFYSVRKESRIIIDELYEESLNDILPEEHIGFIASLVRHPKKYDLPKKIRPIDYAKIGVKLAFRKHEYRSNPSKKLLKEIQSLRTRLKKSSEYHTDTLVLRYGRS